MKLIEVLARAMWTLVFAPDWPFRASPPTTPRRQEGSWVVRDFRFHTGEVLPELRLHYTTVGEPTGEPVLHPAWHDRIGHGLPHTPRSPASSSAPGSRWTRAATTSSCRTPSAPENRASLRTACARAFRSTTTTTWWMPNTGW